MNDAARTVLRKLIEEFGVALARDPHRLGALLRDECGECKREINVLLDAAEEEVVDALRSPAQGSLEITLRVLAKRLHESRGTDEAAALWGVNAWAHALGLTQASVAPAPSARPSPQPSPGPAPAPAPPPQPLWERLQAYLRKPDGSPRWGAIAAIAVVLAYFGWQAFDAGSLRIDSVSHPRQFPADMREVVFNVEFSGRDVVKLERKVIRGTWKDDVIAVKAEGRTQGTVPMVIRARSPEKAAFQLTLVDSAGNRSKPYDVEFEATAPPLRIASVDYPKQFPADNREVKLAVKYDGGDVIKLEVKVLRGGWKNWETTFKPDGKMQGVVTTAMRAVRPEQGAFQLTVVDANGNRSPPYDIEFDAVPAGPGRVAPPAGSSAPRITGIRYPNRIAADSRPVQFEISYEDPDGDVVKLETRSLYGSWGNKVIDYAPSGLERGKLIFEVWANVPGPGRIRFTVIDARGNRSAPFDTSFVAVSVQGSRR